MSESKRSTSGCIGVFWDVEDFPFPNGVSPPLIYHKMKLFVESVPCPAEVTTIVAYVDKEELSDELIRVYDDAGITLFPRQGDVYERYQSMVLDISWWEVDMRPLRFAGSRVMVISKEINKDSPFFTFFKSIASLCHPIYYTPADHDLDPPRRSGWLEPICFNLPSDPIDQNVTLHRTFHRLRSSIEESLDYSHDQTMPDDDLMNLDSSPFDQTMSRSSSSSSRTCVFWDSGDHPLHNDDPWSTYAMLQKTMLEKTLGSCSGDLSLIIYVDEEYIKDDLAGFNMDKGITIIRPQGDKHARVHHMLVDIVLWSLDNPATYFEPRTLMVVSENMEPGTDFRNALEALEKRYYNVLFGDPESPDLIGGRFKPMGQKAAVGFSSGIASLDFHDFSTSEIVTFWDVTGCKTTFASINPVLEKKGYHGPLIIKPYVEMGSPEDVDEDDLVGILPVGMECESRIRVRSEGDKYAKVTRMLLDILFWAMNHDDVPQNLMLISEPFEDITKKCDTVLQALERRGFNIIFKPSHKVACIDDSTVDNFEALCGMVPKQLTNQRHGMYSSRILTDQSRYLALRPVILFWLVKDYPPSNPKKIWNIFKSAVSKKGYHWIDPQLRVYVDKEKISEEMIMVYKSAGITLKVIPENEVHGKITNMLLDFIRGTRRILTPANYIVMSEPFIDHMSDIVVEGLRLRGSNVLYDVPGYVLTFGTSQWSAESLLDGSCTAPSGSSL
ncbi:unnamed protein product [Microthlaspi erraticum]|uniref:NYN domain-containing protein n=1 Tax=Microthlaspi erraticum TaxID=1685480 RepID=A0A6D2JDV1_9BRAS|nr:unnamed protein product [Microthlaspi erraticum]